MKKKLFPLCAMIMAGVFFASCSDKDDEPTADNVLIDILAGNQLNSEGYWDKCYDTKADKVVCGDYVFSHSADVTVWDGVEYKSWKGFCPANCAPVSQAPGNWVDAQWAPVVPLDLESNSDPYLVACADAMESYSEDGNYKPTLYMERKDGKPFTLTSFYISNSAWGYDAMTYGSAFSRPFGAGDYCKINVYYEKADGSVSQISAFLAKGSYIYNDWYLIPGLPDLKRVVFTMESSDSGEWGMNNPAYFLLGNIKVAEDK